MATEKIQSTTIGSPGASDAPEVEREGRAAVARELVLVTLPLTTAIVLDAATESDRTDLPGGVAIVQGPLPFVGLVLSLALLWYFTVRRDAGWDYFGLERPDSWPRTIIKSLGVSLGVLVAVVVLVNPAIGALGLPDRDLSRLDIIENDLPNLLVNLIVVWITAAFVEELLFRGYLINRLVDLQGGATWLTWVVALVGSALIFGLPHFDQGAEGMIHTGAIGFVFGLAFLATGRKLWPVVLSHGLIDTLDFISHYFEAASG